jgi:hypothetical protein
MELLGSSLLFSGGAAVEAKGDLEGLSGFLGSGERDEVLVLVVEGLGYSAGIVGVVLGSGTSFVSSLVSPGGADLEAGTIGESSFKGSS